MFPALSLPSRKFQSVVNTNLAKRLASCFASWCASIIFIPELLRIFEIFGSFEKQKGVCKLVYKSRYKEIHVSL